MGLHQHITIPQEATMAMAMKMNVRAPRRAMPVRRAAVKTARPSVATNAKKSVGDLKKADLEGKVAMVRCDLNVPVDGSTITDDTRIRAAIPTLEYLVENGAKVVVMSHFGRPKDGPEDKFRLTPVGDALKAKMSCKVTKADDCIGDDVKAAVDAMENGSVLLLENTRFYKEETKNDPAFAEKLASVADLFVNDAFGTARRAHASTEGVTKFLSPSVAGFLLAKELEYLDGAIQNGEKPMAAIVGGSKVSSKITVLNALLDKCDKVIIGGGMVFTFLKAKGLPTGTSLCEDDYVDTAKEVLAKAEELGKEVILPLDVVVADAFSADANTKTVPVYEIPEGWMGLDNGPGTTAAQRAALSECKTVIMNGPMGVFEMEQFAKGTFGLVDILADISKKGAVTIIGGGDSVAACEQSGRASEMSHISTGGGASLELLEGKVLPGVAALAEA